MNKPELQAAHLLAQLRQTDPIAEQALATTILPCALKALFTALPVFIAELGKCLAQNLSPDAYDPAPDPDRCK